MTVGTRFTTADLDRMPDIEGIRYEIIDGELYVSRAPGFEHQYVCTVLTSDLHGWNLQTGRGIALGAPGLVLPDDQNCVPDVIWISNERRSGAVDAKGHFNVAPEIVIEVLSPGGLNEQRDRQVKLDFYSRREVVEYWIVDWQERNVEIYRRPRQRLELVARLFDAEAITSPILPGFSCLVSSLWLPD